MWHNDWHGVDEKVRKKSSCVGFVLFCFFHVNLFLIISYSLPLLDILYSFEKYIRKNTCFQEEKLELFIIMFWPVAVYKFIVGEHFFEFTMDFIFLVLQVVY